MRAFLLLAILLFIAWICFWIVVKVVGVFFWVLLGLACVFLILHLITRARSALVQ
jgi:hypothetical protein